MSIKTNKMLKEHRQLALILNNKTVNDLSFYQLKNIDNFQLHIVEVGFNVYLSFKKKLPVILSHDLAPLKCVEGTEIVNFAWIVVSKK